ncbi:hypothetical protein D1BOALGB6SA_3021 [Olavius sp. associated proteobacterium Delta 1]|nr:hypothetical protein D1BOALGB6SA_3021 [Olavius sp. associated proteobacterium Delta 1]
MAINNSKLKYTPGTMQSKDRMPLTWPVNSSGSGIKSTSN